MNGHSEERRRSYRVILMVLLFLGTVMIPFSWAAGPGGPSDVVKNLNGSLLEAMKGGGKLGYEGRYRLLDPVVRNAFALNSMARSAAGKYWDSFTADERKVYLKTYAEWSVANYAGRFNEYSGQQFRLISESPPERNTVTVVSRLVESNRDEVEFNYQIRLVEGSWLIVDVHILGVSQLWLTKAQFVCILGLKGFNGLISMLNNKIRVLSQGNEK